MQGQRASIRGVETFVLAARALSLTAAGEWLGLTTSAVSRRIRDLELDLGVTLFRRFNRRIELTEAGARYLATVGDALDRIQAENAALRREHKGKLVRLSIMPSFAAGWLMPRLAQLRATQPDVEVELESNCELDDLADHRIDAAICFGQGPWQGLVADRLADISLLPVCAPGLVPNRPVSAAALDELVLLTLRQTPQVWPDWLESAGLGGYAPKHLKTFDSPTVLYDAAMAGLGLALGADRLVAPYLAAGRLVAAFDVPWLPCRSSYYLVYRPRDRGWAPLRALSRVLRG